MTWTLAHAAYAEQYPKQPRSGCTGTFRVSEDDGKTPAWLTCDRCDLTITVPQTAVRGEAPPRPTDPLVADPLARAWGM